MYYFLTQYIRLSKKIYTHYVHNENTTKTISYESFFFIRNIVLLLSIFITRKYQQQKQIIPKIIPTTYNYKCTYTYTWPDTNIQKKNHTRVNIQNVYTDTNTMCTKTKNLYSILQMYCFIFNFFWKQIYIYFLFT